MIVSIDQKRSANAWICLQGAMEKAHQYAQSKTEIDAQKATREGEVWSAERREICVEKYKQAWMNKFASDVRGIGINLIRCGLLQTAKLLKSQPDVEQTIFLYGILQEWLCRPDEWAPYPAGDLLANIRSQIHSQAQGQAIEQERYRFARREALAWLDSLKLDVNSVTENGGG